MIFSNKLVDYGKALMFVRLNYLSKILIFYLSSILSLVIKMKMMLCRLRLSSFYVYLPCLPFTFDVYQVREVRYIEKDKREICLHCQFRELGQESVNVINETVFVLFFVFPFFLLFAFCKHRTPHTRKLDNFFLFCC